MSIFGRITERIGEKITEHLHNPTLVELVKEQNLKNLLTRREFRISQAYLQREFLDRAVDQEIPELRIGLYDGYGEIAGKMKKRLLPGIPFSAVFTIFGVEFTPARKTALLKLEKVGPIDLEWLTRKFLQHLPGLSLSGDLISCDLTRVPKLAELFAYRVNLGVKELNPWDKVTIKELSLKEGEIVGKVGVVL